VSRVTWLPDRAGNTILVRLLARVLRSSEIGGETAEEQGEDKHMAASMTTDFSISMSTQVASAALVQRTRRRHITPQAGHALEILGHAIEYLTDEMVHRHAEVFPGSSELEAVQMLMALNRQVYYECPQVPTVGERLRSMLRLRAA
jgi:hypothetical protein